MPEARDIERSRAALRITRGETAPPFHLPTTEGGRATRSSLHGTLGAIVFVTLGCPFCARLAEEAEAVLGASFHGDVVVI